MEDANKKDTIVDDPEEIEKIIKESQDQYDSIIGEKVKADNKSMVISVVLVILICIVSVLIYRTAKTSNKKIEEINNNTKTVTLEIDSSKLDGGNENGK